MGVFMVGRSGRNNLAARGGVLVKLVAALAVIIAGDLIFWRYTQLGSGFGLFAAVLLGAIVAARAGLVSNRMAWGAAAIAALTALALIFDPGPLAAFLFLVAAGVMTLAPLAAKGGDGWQWFQRLGYHGVRAFFAPFLDLALWLKLRGKQRRMGKSGRFTRHLPALVLPLIGSIAFVTLFAAANPVLESWLMRLHLPVWREETIARMIIWALLFWLSWSLLRPALPRRVAGTAEGRGDVAIPGVTPQSLRLSLVAFNLLFLMQNGMDLVYLSGLTPLPDGMTLAEYAHRGAYPLIVTALLAGLFTLITLRPGSTSARDPFVRRLLVLWIAQNILLVGSSIERTLDYISVYSLTQWRIAALVWMALVAVGLALICWRMLRDKNASWLINANLLATGIVLLGYCFVDTGAMAAQWNVRHAKEVGGKGAALDLCYLDTLRGSALLPLVELEGREGLAPAFRARVTIVRNKVQSDVTRDQTRYFWTWRNAGRLAKAEAARGKVSPDDHSGDYQCDGNPIPPVPITGSAAPIEGPVDGNAPPAHILPQAGEVADAVASDGGVTRSRRGDTPPTCANAQATSPCRGGKAAGQKSKTPSPPPGPVPPPAKVREHSTRSHQPAKEPLHVSR
ncbi:DUF4173 domain-containing protein [Pseudonocardia sp. TMWB2A]